jgi:hypothetical protein
VDRAAPRYRHRPFAGIGDESRQSDWALRCSVPRDEDGDTVSGSRCRLSRRPRERYGRRRSGRGLAVGGGGQCGRRANGWVRCSRPGPSSRSARACSKLTPAGLRKVASATSSSASRPTRCSTSPRLARQASPA